jgi:hypothetical protein
LALVLACTFIPLAQPCIAQTPSDGWQTAYGADGIGKAITRCALQPVPCLLYVPGAYPQTESQPFGGLYNGGQGALIRPWGPKLSEGTAGVLDMRWGVPHWLFSASLPEKTDELSAPEFVMNSTGYGQQLGAWGGTSMHFLSTSYMGGRNFTNLLPGLGDKTNFNAVLIHSYKYTQTQDTGQLAQYARCYGNGDCVGHQIETFSYGGPNANADEATESMRYIAVQGGVVFSARVDSIQKNSDGALEITTRDNVNGGTQGEGRLLIDLSQRYSVGYITRIQSGNQTKSKTIEITCDNCSLDLKYGISTKTTLLTPVGNGTSRTNTFPKKNIIVNVESSSSFTAGKVACIFDYDYECETVSDIPDSTHIAFAILRMPHAAKSWIVTGGLTGYAWESEADRFDPQQNNGVHAPPNTDAKSIIRLAQPIIMNSLGGVVTLFTGRSFMPGTGEPYITRAYPQMGKGGSVRLTIADGLVTACSAEDGSGYSPAKDTYGNPVAPPQITLQGDWTTPPAVHIGTVHAGALAGCVVDAQGARVKSANATVTPVNAYDIYPAAKVWQVYNSSKGEVDGTLWTDPTTGTFAVNDTVEQPHFYLQNTKGSYNQIGTLFPATQTGNSGLVYFMGGVLTGTDQASFFTNLSQNVAYAGSPQSQPWLPGNSQISPPIGHRLRGPFSAGLVMDDPPFGKVFNNQGSAVVYVWCHAYPCSTYTKGFNFLESRNALNGADVVSYNPVSASWIITSGATQVDGGSASCTYSFGNSLASSCGIKSTSYTTATICSSTASPAQCGAAIAGKVQVAASERSLVIQSTGFKDSTGCWFTYDITGSTAPDNIATMMPPYISAKTPGKSITISLGTAPADHAVNIQFGCLN